jgi:integrase
VYRREYPSGLVSWIVDLGKIGDSSVRRRRTFETQAAANDFAQDLRRARHNEGMAAFALTPEQRVDAIRCIDMLQAYEGETPLKACTYYVQNVLKFRTAPPLRDICNGVLEEMKQKNVRPKSLHTMNSFLNRLVAALNGKALAEVSQDDVKAICFEAGLEPKTQRNRLGMTSQLFNFALRNKWVSENIVKNISKPAKVHTEHVVLTVPQVARLLELAPDYGLMAYCLLGLFAGVRAAELQRLDWPYIVWPDREIKLTAAATKIGQRRVFDIDETLAAWLEPYVKATGPISPRGAEFDTAFQKLRKAAGITNWPHNAMRHTFVSYHIAHFKNPSKTCLIIGHIGDSNLLHNNYKSIVPTAEAKKFWALRPGKTKPKGEAT